MKVKLGLMLFSLFLTSVLSAQQKTECSWSTKQAGVPGAPIRVSPSIFNIFLKETPAGVNPNPEFKGLFVLKVTSNKNGEIVDACALRAPDASLVNSAIQTVKTWKANPYFLNKKPVAIESVVGLSFENKLIKFEAVHSAPETTN